MVPRRTFNIYGTFPLDKMFFIVEKNYSDKKMKCTRMVLLKSVHWEVFREPKILLQWDRFEKPDTWNISQTFFNETVYSEPLDKIIKNGLCFNVFLLSSVI